MKTIQVKYLGPTNSRGTRYRVTAEGVPAMTVSYDYALSPYENANAAVRAFCARTGWKGVLHHGLLPNGAHVFVFEDLKEALVV